MTDNNSTEDLLKKEKYGPQYSDSKSAFAPSDQRGNLILNLSSFWSTTYLLRQHLKTEGWLDDELLDVTGVINLFKYEMEDIQEEILMMSRKSFQGVYKLLENMQMAASSIELAWETWERNEDKMIGSINLIENSVCRLYQSAEDLTVIESDKVEAAIVALKKSPLEHLDSSGVHIRAARSLLKSLCQNNGKPENKNSRTIFSLIKSEIDKCCEGYESSHNQARKDGTNLDFDLFTKADEVNASMQSFLLIMDNINRKKIDECGTQNILFQLTDIAIECNKALISSLLDETKIAA